MNWLLPPGSSTFTADIDWLYYVILWVTGFAFVATEAMLVFFLFRYRARAGVKARYYHGNTRAEIIWTSVTAVAVLILGVMSAGGWNRIKGRDSIPPNALPILVHSKQFEWQITYPGPDLQLGNADDFTVRSQLHVPVDRPVNATLTSEDAIHSFFVPVWRIKQDAVPGMRIQVWFQPTQTGAFELACAELCGLGHYRMRGSVTVHTQEEFDRWIRNRGQLALRQ